MKRMLIVLALIVSSALPAAAADVAISVPVGTHAKPRCDAYLPVAGAAVAAQIVDGAVTANAVGHGSIGKPLFGSNHSALGYIGGEFALDAVIWAATHRASCAVRTAAAGVLGASAVLNAADTEFRK